MYGYQGSNFPDGFSRGVAIQQLPIVNLVSPDNSVLWVDANSTKHGYGTYKDPFATIDDAIGKASAGDTILIAAGHTENLSSATIFQVDVASLTIIGLGENQRVPTFSTTAAAGCVNIDSANCHIRNIKLVANFSTGTTTAIDIAAAADGCTLDKITFRDTSAANEFLIHVNVATTVANLTIRDCDFTTAAGSMTSSIYFVGTSDHVRILNNDWHVDCSASVIDHLTDVPTNIVIKYNDIVNIDVSAGLGIGLKSDGAGTGKVKHNTVLTPATGAAVLAVTNDYFVAQNFCANDINTSGVLNPAADTI